MSGSAGLRLQQHAAKLLSDIRDSCRTSQKAVNTLVSGVQDLTSLFLDVLKEKFLHDLKASDGYLTVQQVVSVLDSFQRQSIFEGVGECSKMESYFRDTSGGSKVLLKQVVVKTKIVMRKGLPVEVPHQFGYSVPFLAQLEQLLNCPDVLKCVDNPLPSKPGHYANVTDGLFYKYHPLVLEHGPSTLIFNMHVDDAEPCDALKSKAGKNSLRLFYWCLLNIYPELRSSLRSINLLAIALARVCKKYGNDFLLRDFVEALKILGTEGVDFNINGSKRRMYGALLFASCDNPAAANLGKFKETFSAVRSCRVCMMKTSDMCQHYREDTRLIRKKVEHELQVKKVLAHKNPSGPKVIEIFDEDDPMAAQEMEVIEEWNDEKDPSVSFGINGKSILSEVPYFDVTKCFPQDIMHVFNEGVVEMVCRLVLKDLCLPPKPKEKPLIPLAFINKCIDTYFDLGHLNVNKPSEITKDHLTGKKLKQSASQMLVLLRLLPFIVFQKCPKDRLDLLLHLNFLMDSCLAFKTTGEGIADLDKKIEDFGEAFKQIYPNKKSLKLHVLVHLGTQSKLFGPLRQQWTYRFEAMHSLFTQLFPVVRCMKNPALTGALRHLAKRNAELCEENYLTEKDGYFGTNEVGINDVLGKDCILRTFPELTKVSVVKRFSHRGANWQEGVIMYFKENKTFARIESVFIVDKKVFFTYNALKTEYISMFNAYEILACEQEYDLICFDELKHKFPMWRISCKLPNYLRSFIIVHKPVGVY